MLLFLSAVVSILVLYLIGVVVRSWLIFGRINVKTAFGYPFFVEVCYPAMQVAISSSEERFAFIQNASKDDTDLRKFCFGPLMGVLINDRECMQKVLMSSDIVGKPKMLYDLVGFKLGLITVNSKETWKPLRKFFNPSFNLTLIESFIPTARDHTIKLCRSLEQHVDQAEFDFYLSAKDLFFDLMCEYLLGMSPMEDETKKAEIIGAFDT
jgi:Cytochrome P450